MEVLNPTSHVIQLADYCLKKLYPVEIEILELTNEMRSGISHALDARNSLTFPLTIHGSTSHAV